ncbi:LpxA family transferase [Methylobacterium sp. J-077]|uniref:LpxA family transferase n=1 Tax=Methylobacterium sp. J-077 TaxID=2836656 RepID=UPI001FB939B2|nr:LpxA family transferase [Methylobacterium sp. J-077]MCJ2122892.1 LpxA family transferase [Methylobacterium sp. J-077]
MADDCPDLRDLIARYSTSWLGALALAPWAITARAAALIAERITGLDGTYRVADGVAIHAQAIVEAGATVKPPAIIGPGCLVAAGAYLRGGCWLEADCTIGPGAELKSAFLFAGAAAAHFNFVGDSILGTTVNLEAGAIIANHRNEAPDRPIVLRFADRLIETGTRKFGALVGDGARIGANAVIAPGAVIGRNTVVPRLGLIDQGC